MRMKMLARLNDAVLSSHGNESPFTHCGEFATLRVPMKLITRYVLFELLQVFLISLTAMTLFMVIVGVLSEAQQNGLGLKQVLLLLPYILPNALRFAVPGTVLFATCSVYGRLAAHNEVVALKAAGVNPWVIFAPAFVIGVLLSLGTVWLNDVAVSWGRDGIRRVVIESVEEIAYGKLTLEKKYVSKGFSIYVQRVDGKRLIEPVITIVSGDKKQTRINAAEAQLRSDLVNNTLSIILTNFVVDGVLDGKMNYRDPGTKERVIDLSDSTRKGTGSSTSDIPMNMIPSEIEDHKRMIVEKREEMAALAGLFLVTGDYIYLNTTIWDAQHNQLKEIQGRIHKLEMEPHRRWANGFSCLCFMAVGAPLAVLRRNAEFMTNFIICFMPILLGYYPLLMFSVSRAKSGSMPSEIVWFGNVVLLLVGWWLYRKVKRY
jgi:lipopolysaccharide export system permease protein